MLQCSSRGGLPGPGGVVAWSGGVVAWSRGGGCLVSGGWLPGPGGGWLPGPRGVLRRPPPVNRITDTCKNITLATTSLRPVTSSVADPGFPQKGCADLLLLPANEVWGKVIFLHLSVILFRGGYLGGYTPPGQVHPPGRYPRPPHPPPAPPPHPMVNTGAVRILLECILVWHNFCRTYMKMEENGPRGRCP